MTRERLPLRVNPGSEKSLLGMYSGFNPNFSISVGSLLCSMKYQENQRGFELLFLIDGKYDVEEKDGRRNTQQQARRVVLLFKEMITALPPKTLVFASAYEYDDFYYPRAKAFEKIMGSSEKLDADGYAYYECTREEFLKNTSKYAWKPEDYSLRDLCRKFIKKQSLKWWLFCDVRHFVGVFLN